MKKKIPLIISAIIFIAGCVTTITGAIRSSGARCFLPALDLFSISEDDVGKRFGAGVYAGILRMEDTENGALYVLMIYNDPDAEQPECTVMAFDIPASSARAFEKAQESDDYIKVPFSGTLRKSSALLTEKIEKCISDYCESTKQLFEEAGIEYPDEAFREINNKISPYYVEVADTSDGIIIVYTGCAVMAAAVIVILTAFFGRKAVLVIAAVIVTPVLVLLILFADKLRTISTVTEVADGLYKMSCHHNYKCDEFLNADISTTDDFAKWLSDEFFFGLPVGIGADNFGCSAFAAMTPDGQHLFGRNFDYDETDALIIYTEPENGYASYGLVDLKFLDIGTQGGFDGNSVPAKFLMLAAPYITMDGINEAGVGVGVLQLDIRELHQDNGKPDLLVSSAVRGILDKCASVDEALALLDNYDMHSCLNVSYHLFITDKTGKSVIVEWTEGETYLVDDTVCTNSVMSNNEFYDPLWFCNRYSTIKRELFYKNGVLTENEAMGVAADASWDESDMTRGTEWSCVYNLDDFSFDICLDRDYSTKYTFAKENF